MLWIIHVCVLFLLLVFFFSQWCRAWHTCITCDIYLCIIISLYLWLIHERTYLLLMSYFEWTVTDIYASWYHVNHSFMHLYFNVLWFIFSHSIAMNIFILYYQLCVSCNEPRLHLTTKFVYASIHNVVSLSLNKQLDFLVR